MVGGLGVVARGLSTAVGERLTTYRVSASSQTPVHLRAVKTRVISKASESLASGLAMA